MASTNATGATASSALSSIPDTSDAGEIIQAMRDLHRPHLQPIDLEAPHALVLPKGMQAQMLTEEHLDAFRELPRVRETTDRVQDLASLIALTKRHAHAPETVVLAFADRAAPRIVTVFDYHPANADRRDARRRAHQVIYPCALSEEWQAWVKVHRQGMKQAQFAEFIEDRISDVVVPSDTEFPAAKQFATLMGMRLADPAELVQLSRGLQVTLGSTFKQAQALSTGESSLTFETRHETTQVANTPVQVPGLFLIAIPAFFGGQRFVMPVRLRYRVSNGGLEWTLVLHRHEQAFDDAFRGMLAEIRTECPAIPVLLGSLEG